MTTKIQALLIGLKGTAGKDATQIMDKIVADINQHPFVRATGLPIRDDKEHDDQFEKALKDQWDIISFGGGLRMTSESWANRLQAMIDASRNKDVTIVYPMAPNQAAPMVVEAAEKMKA